MSRTFFEAPINGSIRYQPGADAQPVAYTFESPVSWQEYPPTAPAPQAGYIADFRDFQGCARFNQSDDAALCFNIMPDVSSVSLTRESLTTQGIQTVVNRYLHDQATRGCEQSVQTLNFERANKSGDSFTVRYIAQLDSQGTCASDQAAIEITLTKE